MNYDADGAVGYGYIDPDETITLDEVYFVKGDRGRGGYESSKTEKNVIQLGKLTPVVYSEVCIDLNVLRSKQK